jgi:hypothetical protein
MLMVDRFHEYEDASSYGSLVTAIYLQQARLKRDAQGIL